MHIQSTNDNSIYNRILADLAECKAINNVWMDTLDDLKSAVDDVESGLTKAQNSYESHQAHLREIHAISMETVDIIDEFLGRPVGA